MAQLTIGHGAIPILTACLRQYQNEEPVAMQALMAILALLLSTG